MQPPERIWARPMGTSRDWNDIVSGPWSLENPYGSSVEYVRADIVNTTFTVDTALAERVRNLEEVSRRVINLIQEQGRTSTPNPSSSRAERDWCEGPERDQMFKIALNKLESLLGDPS